MESCSDRPSSTDLPRVNAPVAVKKDWLDKHIGKIVDNYVMADVDKVSGSLLIQHVARVELVYFMVCM